MYFCSDIPDPGSITGIMLFVFGRLVEGMGAAGVTLALVYLINVIACPRECNVLIC